MANDRPYYDKALAALTAAHKACYEAWDSDPKRNPLGMSFGPFAGVNIALGIIDELEQRLNRASNSDPK